MLRCTVCDSEDVVDVVLSADRATEPRCDAHREPVDAGLSVDDLIGRLIRAVDRATAAAIDAGACQTRGDYRRAADADDMASLVRERVVAALESRVDTEVHHQRKVARAELDACRQRAERAEARVAELAALVGRMAEVTRRTS